MRPTSPRLILASTSRYKRAQFARLGLAHECVDPGVDESAAEGETGAALAARLAEAKAVTVVREHPDAVVVATDQVGECAGALLNKPGSHRAAVRQLMACAGCAATFHTALAVWDPKERLADVGIVPTELRFRTLNETQAERYVATDQPFDCAGSFKIEQGGIALFEYVRADDPSALIGLPLIRTAEALRRLGIDPLG